MKKINVLGTIVADSSQKWADCDVCPADVLGALAERDDEGFELAINSPGGDVAGGLAICNMIKSARAAGVKVTAHVYGLAASMASVIACAADEIVMDEGAFLMVHNPWTYAGGNAEELRETADVLDKMRDAILGFYLDKFEKSADEIKALLDAETWIAGTEAAAYGLKATVVPSTVRAAACISRRAFDKAPEAARALFTVQTEKPLTDAEKLAKCEAQRASWQASADRAKAELATVRAELDAAKAENAALSASVAALTAERDAARKKFDDLTKEAGALKDSSEKLKAAEARIAELEAARKAAAMTAYAPVSTEDSPEALRRKRADEIAAARSPEEREAIRAKYRNVVRGS